MQGIEHSRINEVVIQIDDDGPGAGDYDKGKRLSELQQGKGEETKARKHVQGGGMFSLIVYFRIRRDDLMWDKGEGEGQTEWDASACQRQQ